MPLLRPRGWKWPRFRWPKMPKGPAEKRVFQKETKDGLIFKFDIDDEDVHVDVKNGRLVITGKKQDTKGPHEKETRTKNSYSYSYSSGASAGSFVKSFSIPSVDARDIHAQIHGGVLSIVVPHPNEHTIEKDGVVPIEVDGDQQYATTPQNTL